MKNNKFICVLSSCIQVVPILFWLMYWHTQVHFEYGNCRTFCKKIFVMLYYALRKLMENVWGFNFNVYTIMYVTSLRKVIFACIIFAFLFLVVNLQKYNPCKNMSYRALNTSSDKSTADFWSLSVSIKVHIWIPLTSSNIDLINKSVPIWLLQVGIAVRVKQAAASSVAWVSGARGKKWNSFPF